MSKISKVSSVLSLVLLMIVIVNIGCSDEEKTVQPTGPGEVRFYIVSGDRQDCIPMDTLPNRMVVKVDRGADYPLRSVYLTFGLTDGNGQVAVKPTDNSGVTAVKVPTDGLGMAYIQFQAFEDCQAIVRGSVDTIPGLSVSFTINPGPACGE